MNQPIIFYHIFLYPGWETIVNDQINTLKQSKLLDVSLLKVGVVYINETEKDVNLLNSFFFDIPNVEFLFYKHTSSCGECDTLIEIKKLCEIEKTNRHILYIHSKGVTQHNSVRELPVKEWRKMMEYFLIEKWEDCINKLNEGYDCCGINYQNHAGTIKNQPKLIKIFNGNFFWVNLDYVKKLDESILFEHRYSAENWILSVEHKSYSFINVPPSFDLYYNIYINYRQ